MSKKQKRTPWFLANLSKPTRIGWYEVGYRFESYEGDRLYWDGKRWMVGETMWPALFGRGFGGDKWRGLAEKPK